MRHAAVLDLCATHSFNADGRCREVAFLPAPETAVLLRKHRCLMRCEAGRTQVLVPVEETGEPVLPLPAGAALRFTLEARGDLSRVTDLSALDAMKAPLFTNRDGRGQALSLVEAPAATNRRPGVLAAVEVALPAGAAGPPLVLELAFKARKAHWAYYCVTNLQAGKDGLHIVDSGAGAQGTAIQFSEANTRSFDAATPQARLMADPLAALLVKQNPTMRCIRFLSDKPVEMREEPRRGLELRLGADPVLRPLPNPAPQSTSATAVTLGQRGGSPRVIEAQAHIIRYIAKTLATQT